MFERVKHEEFWSSVRENALYAPIIEKIKQIYLQNHDEQLTVISYSDRWLYYKEGNRSAMESPYFRRRSCLSAAAILALIYPEEEHYITEIQDIIWSICDEYCWAVPAHTSGELQEDLTCIDLFVSETGFALTEICQILGDRLEKTVRVRAEYEVRRRIIEPYKSRRYWWETGTNNWAAVCACCTGGVFMYLEPELFRKYTPQFIDAMNCFISGFPEDGTCLEGHSYWLYGFGHFVWFADMLYRFTDGKTDLLKGEKIEAIASYMQRNFMLGSSTVSFADGVRQGKADIGIQHYLHKRLPNVVDLLPEELMDMRAGNVKWMNYLRTLLYYDTSAKASAVKLEDYYLKKAGQLILNRPNYSFAVKAGHNDEPHNHNDIGNFIFCDKNGQVFCDLGAGLYTKKYFDSDTRYGVFCNSSFSHNVPIVGGEPQKAGIGYKGTLEWKDGIATVEMSGAYGIDSLRRLTRTVIPSDSGITLCDEFDTDETRLIERFVTLIEPAVEGGCVNVGSTSMRFEGEKCDISISTQLHEKHGFKYDTETVYCIDFTLKPGVKKTQFDITVIE